MYLRIFTGSLLFCICLCFFLHYEADLIFGTNNLWVKVVLYWPVFYAGMLLRNYSTQRKIRPLYAGLICALSIVLFYIVCWLTKNNHLDSLGIVPLIVLCVGAYYLFCSDNVNKIMEHKLLQNFVLVVGAVSLEAYMIQFAIINDRLNGLFPLNIILIFITVILFSIFIRTISKFILQTFSNEKYCIKELFDIKK